MADADGKMRKDAKKSKKSNTRNADGKNKKINKQTNNGKSLSHGWALHVQYALSIVGTGYSGF